MTLAMMGMALRGHREHVGNGDCYGGNKGIQGGTSKEEIKYVCLNARIIINKKNELNIIVDDIKPHIIGITESWANNDITDAELGLEGYEMFRKDIIERRGGGVLLYIKETIPAYEVQLQEEADCNEAIWCKLVTGHTTVTIGVVYRCPNITKQNNEKLHTVEPLSNDHPHQRPSLLYDHISCDGQCFLFVRSLTSDHPSDATSDWVRWNFLPRGRPHRVFQNDLE